MARKTPEGLRSFWPDPWHTPEPYYHLIYGKPKPSRGEGLRVRFSRVKGVTHPSLLRRALYLPAVLGDFTVREESPTDRFSTVSGGEFSTSGTGPSGAHGLRTTDIEALTLDWDAAWLVQPGLYPNDVKAELLALMRHKNRGVFELMAQLRLGKHKPHELRMKAKIVSIERTLKHGEADTRYYTMQVEEWRPMRVKRRGTGSAVHEEEHRTLPTTHRLKATTDLHGLAKLFYNDRSAWRVIRDANGITKKWGPDTPLVKLGRYKVGSKIKIPARSLGTRDEST